MTLKEATSLLLHEGLSREGIPVNVRMGEDPGKDRLDAVSQAIDLLHHAPSQSPNIDRQLALALWAIGFHGYFQSLSWQEQEGDWRDGDFNDQILDIGSRIEEWLGQGLPEVA